MCKDINTSFIFLNFLDNSYIRIPWIVYVLYKYLYIAKLYFSEYFVFETRQPKQQVINYFIFCILLEENMVKVTARVKKTKEGSFIDHW